MRDDAELACIMAPIAGGNLLLPNVAVAEVLRSQRIRSSDGLPPFCVGRIMWRGVILPLLRFEAANASDASVPPIASSDGVLVMNRTRDLKAFGFYGLLTRGTPRLLRLTEEDVDEVSETAEGGSGGAAELGRLYVGEDVAIVPRLSYLEDLILEHRLYGAPAKA